MSIDSELYRYITFRHLQDEPDITRVDRQFLINKRIKYLPTVDSLFVLSRIDAFLSSAETVDKSIQKQLIRKIFNSGEAETLEDMLDSANNRIFLHYQQVYYCMGLLLLYGNDEFWGRLPDEFLPKIGLTLVAVNETLEQLTDNTDVARFEEGNGYLWQMGHLTLPTDRALATELSRIYVIFEEENQPKIFAQKFYEVTGVELLAFWTVVFAIYLRWMASVENILQSGLIIGKEYFKQIKTLNEHQIQKSLALLSTNPAEMKLLHVKQLNAFDYEPFNFEFLREKPLLEYQDGKYICLSIPYLILRGTRGVSEIIRTHCGVDKFGTEVSNSLGEAYEQYVKSLVQKTYIERPKLAHRFIDRKCKSIELADGIIDYGSELIILEVKAISIQKRYRLSSKRKDLESGLRDFLIRKGAKQLNRNINMIRSGEKIVPGIKRETIKRYYPVLITCIDDLPLFNTLYDYYCEILR